MKNAAFLVQLLLVCLSAAQTTEDLDVVLNEIFTRAPETSTKNDGGCECVPYYLCSNETIITDGTGVIDIRLGADRTCNDIFSVCCNPPEIVDKPITRAPPVEKPKGCGIRNFDGISIKIIGDEDETQFGEFPWMVAVFRQEKVEGSKSEYFCGGSLIHPHVVLTAAHCVTRKDMTYKVRAGEWDTQTENEIFNHEERDVQTVIKHPEYYSGGFFNDIALLILEDPIDISQHINTICLPDEEVSKGTQCLATGWGQDVFGKKDVHLVTLKKVDLPIVARNVCQDQLRKTRLGSRFKLHPSFICAGGEGKDTCKGDGGSPLVCPIPNEPGRYYQAGIVSWGVKCGVKDEPGLYANVAHLKEWIEQEMEAYNFDQEFCKIPN